MWYVVQVIKGRERAMVERLERVASASELDECFSPQFETEIKVGGSWVRCEKELLPGYLIAATDDPCAIERHLREAPEFARVLRQDGAFVPLSAEEVDLIACFTHQGERCVPMSMAIKEGDRVVVMSGPLVGHEGLIKSVNRRKSVAYLELSMCGRIVSARVGLGVLTRDAWAMRAMQVGVS